MTFIPSPQQAAFMNFAITEDRSCVLVAVAGAGKTTTILETVEKIGGTSAILAFNKKIAEEIKAKLKKRGVDWKKAEAGTVHSFGLRAYRKMFKDVEVRGYKVGDLCAEMIESGVIGELIAPLSATICQLVSLAKQRALGIVEEIDDHQAWMDIVEHFDLLDYEEMKHLPAIIMAAQRLLTRSNKLTEIIDFDDMVYLPMIVGCRFWQYDNLWIDEAQDTNTARRELAKRMLKPGGRIFAVGDRAQAIYGFTGADADSLDLIKAEFNCVEMPLTVTYRCPKAVVTFAQRWMNHIQAHPTAPTGRVSSMTFEEMIARKDLNQDSAILCRNTKPLVSAAFAMIRARIPCKIEGREIGNGLKLLATRWSSIKTINALEAKLVPYLEKEVEKAKKKKKDTLVQQIEDKVDTLRVVMNRVREEGGTDITAVVAYIDSLFADNVTGIITLSTIHKSKGREWKRVYWLDRTGTCPSPFAKQPWEMTQEVNLQYVAATRSMDELIDLFPPLPVVANVNAPPATPVAANDDQLDIPEFLRRTA